VTNGVVWCAKGQPRRARNTGSRAADGIPGRERELGRPPTRTPLFQARPPGGRHVQLGRDILAVVEGPVELLRLHRIKLKLHLYTSGYI